MAQKEVAKAQVFLDGKQAETVIDTLKKEAKELRTELKKAFEVGDTAKIKELEGTIKKNEQATRSLKKETFDYAAVLKNINGASYNELNQALKTTQTQLKRLKQTDAGYRDKEAEVQRLKTKIGELNSSTRATTSIWSKMAAGANKWMGAITVGLAAITGVGYSVAQLIKGITGLDDALANVQKTTGLTRKEVRELYGDFKQLNTRTSKSVLLEYAEEAGRLGKKGKKDVLEFVEVANKIGTALGDDLANGPEAIREVGKLVEIYKVGNQYNVGFGESMEKIGSAINEIGANSSASAPYQIDFLKRLSGTAMQANITAAEILGYSSVLEQNGQAVEMAATAQGKLMIDMFTKPGEYAEIAGMKVADFTKLLETDANAAFLKFLEGINGNNEGFSKMAVKLDELGVDGSRAVQVLSTLASNTDKVRKEQELANKAMNEGVSLTNEYNIKNNNLAGSWEKIGIAIKSKFINSGLIGFFENVISKAAKLTEVSPVAIFEKERIEVNALVSELSSAQLPLERRNAIYERLREIAPDVVEGINTESINYQALNENLQTYNDLAIQRIALKKLELELEAEREKIADLFLKKDSKRAEVLELIASHSQFENIMMDEKLTLEEKLNKVNEEQLRINTKVAAAGQYSNVIDLAKPFKQLKQYEKEYNELFTSLIEKQKDYQQKLDEAIKEGINSNSAVTPVGGVTPIGDSGVVETKKRTIEVINDEISALQNEQKALSDSASIYQEYQSKITTLEKEREAITKDALNTKIRTVEVINAEISALQKEQQTRATSADSYKQYQDKIIALEKERLSITGSSEKEVAKESKKATDLLKEYETYLEKRHRLIKEYEQKRIDIIDAGGNIGNLAMVDAEEEQKLQEIDRQILEKQANFESWARGMTAMGLDALTKALTQAQLSLIANTHKGTSEEDLAALRARIEMMKKQVQALKQESESSGKSKKNWGNTIRIMNDVYENVGNIIKQFEDLDETTKLALSSAMNIAAGTIAMITGISDLATMAALNVRAVEKASVILAIIGAALQIVMAIFNFANKAHDKKYEQEVAKLEGAIKSLQERYEELEKAVENTFGNKRQRNIEEERRNMEEQIKLMDQQIAAEKQKKKPDQGSIDNLNSEIKNLGNEIENLPSLADTLFGDDLMSAVEDFANAWVNAWRAGEDMIASQQEIVDNMIAQVIASLMSERLQDAIAGFREALAEAWADGVVDDEERYILGLYRANIEALSAEGTDLLEQSGLTQETDENSETTNSGTSSGAGSGPSTMNQETGNELNGRFTAFQSSNEVIKIETIKIGSIIEDMKGLQLRVITTLGEIKENTDYLPTMDEKLGKIEKYMQEA